MTRNFVESINSRSRIVRNQEWDPALAKLNTLNFAQFVFCLLYPDSVHSEAALGVVDEAEVFAGLVNGDDIHESSRVGRVGADFAIDFDQTLHYYRLRFACVEGVFEPIQGYQSSFAVMATA
jgi:hypothetical protein